MSTLTLEQAYYIGELVGVLAIVVSLLFVAVQIQQNTRTIRYEVRNKMRERYLNLQLIMAQQEDLCDVYIRGNKTFESLNELEERRFFMICGYELNAMSEIFSSFQDGMLSVNYWDSVKIGIMNEMQGEGIQKYWESKKHLYADSFQMFINELLQKNTV